VIVLAFKYKVSYVYKGVKISDETNNKNLAESKYIIAKLHGAKSVKAKGFNKTSISRINKILK
jgi:hypothetical protein